MVSSDKLKVVLFLFWVAIKISIFANVFHLLENTNLHYKEWPFWIWAWILLTTYVMFMSFSFEYAYFFVFGEYKKAVLLLFFGNFVIQVMLNIVFRATTP